jgi:hypothetical protein
MFGTAFAPQLSLRNSSRVPVISRTDQVTGVELVCLLLCGVLAAAAVGFLHLSLRLPGHAILRGVLPMALGYALVPRRMAGTLMAISAGIAATSFSALHIGSFPVPAMLSVFALGPVLDAAFLGRSTGWRLYAKFVFAGAVANLFAYALKVVGVWLGMEMFSGGGNFARLNLLAVVSSYMLCGALAGLLGAAACFRARGNDDLRRD